MSLLTLMFAVAASVAGGSTIETPAVSATHVIAPGLEHLVLRRGTVSPGTSYRAVVGEFRRQSEADVVLRQLVDAGFSVFPESLGHEYWIVTSGHENRSEAEKIQHRIAAMNLAPAVEIQEIEDDPEYTNGPWRIHVLVADPGRIDVRVAHAYDSAIGLETTADLASRHGAAAAVNGGYFRMTGTLAGDSLGVLRIAGRLLSEPDRGRAAVGFSGRDGAVRTVFGRLSFQGSIILADGTEIALDGLNRPRGASDIILYTPDFHRTTLTRPDGAEVILRRGKILEVREGVGSSLIPSDGTVLSIGSQRIGEVLPSLSPGEAASVATELIPLLPDPDDEWEEAEYVLGGGPLLLWKGRRIVEPEKESISKVFFLSRHPRTAVGVREDGTLLFVTVDGRQPGESVGMSIPELTDLMLELGAVSAINLDGGGSTTMVVAGQVVNVPTDVSGARHNADAILLFPTPEQDQRTAGKVSTP